MPDSRQHHDPPRCRTVFRGAPVVWVAGRCLRTGTPRQLRRQLLGTAAGGRQHQGRQDGCSSCAGAGGRRRPWLLAHGRRGGALHGRWRASGQGQGGREGGWVDLLQEPGPAKPRRRVCVLLLPCGCIAPVAASCLLPCGCIVPAAASYLCCPAAASCLLLQASLQGSLRCAFCSRGRFRDRSRGCCIAPLVPGLLQGSL